MAAAWIQEAVSARDVTASCLGDSSAEVGSGGREVISGSQSGPWVLWGVDLAAFDLQAGLPLESFPIWLGKSFLIKRLLLLKDLAGSVLLGGETSSVAYLC